jgi:hypothetical protein
VVAAFILVGLATVSALFTLILSTVPKIAKLLEDAMSASS